MAGPVEPAPRQTGQLEPNSSRRSGVATWDSYPQMALIATMALALRGLASREQAFETAQQYWDARNKSI
jgi:hypothetical protein